MTPHPTRAIALRQVCSDLHNFVLVLAKQKPKSFFCFDRSKYHCKTKKSFVLILLKTKTKHKIVQVRFCCSKMLPCAAVSMRNNHSLSSPKETVAAQCDLVTLFAIRSSHVLKQRCTRKRREGQDKKSNFATEHFPHAHELSLSCCTRVFSK